MIFTTLIAGFCAFYSTVEHQPVVEIGTIQKKECVSFAMLGNSKGQQVKIPGPGKNHLFGTDIYINNAVVYMDGDKFTVPREDDEDYRKA